MAPTALDESLFLNQLLQGLDDDFFSAVPSPDPSPVKPKPLRLKPTLPSTPTKKPKPSLPLLSSNLPSALDYDASSFLQGSENWDLDDFSISPVKPRSSKLKSTSDIISVEQVEAKPSFYVPDPCTRCVVESVTEESVDNQWRKSISARVQPGDELVDVFLYNDWYPTDIRIDDIFNVLGTFSKSQGNARRTVSITSQSNMIILHPDLLLTATALSNAPQCRRKPILSSLVRSTSDVTPALVWGSMLHEVMQRCLTEDRWEETFIDHCINEAVLGGLGELVKIGLSEDIARTEVAGRAKGMKLFKDKYLSQHPKPTAILTNTRSGASDTPSLLAITKLLDIEEDIWSPTFGLKGKLDATVQGIISDPSSSSSPSSYHAPPSYTQTNTPLPLELKTGRSLAGMEHRAQTMLYTLLLSERYGVDTKDGLLFYTQSEEGEIVRVPRGRNEIRGLISARNEMASYMWRRIRKGKPRATDVDMEVDIEDASGVSAPNPPADEGVEDEPFLPPPIDDERTCQRCYALDTCLLFRKTHPNHSSSAPKKKRLTYDPPIPSFLASVFDARTGHLTPTQTAFFRDWERLLALEERDLVRFKRELWTLGAAEREKRGRCFSGMVVNRQIKNYGAADKTGGEWGKEGKIHRYTYSFVRSRTWVAPSQSSATQSPTSMRNLLNGHLNTGDPITVSIEPNLLALARGYILELNPEEVVLGVDHVLDTANLKERTRPADDDSELVFRIDKDELFGSMARVRSNLAQLFYAGGDAKRLSLVVDLRQPIFSAPTPPFSVTPADPSSSPHLAHLNPSQLEAMHKVLSAEDYALILGMPGTGKTTVIAALIRELVRRGKTVLLSSYTHSAVDTILMKLENEGGGKDGAGASFGVLRLGNADKVHPDVRKYTLNARRTATTVEQLEAQLMSPPVVATTCLSIDQNFDYCIVDEASQITLPTCLGPLKFADTFVLVGDHFQLPPLVKNPEARKGGLDVSLFRRLSEAHPEAVVDLRFQYRMNQEIMTLSNRLIYEDRLRCGNEEVANWALELTDRTFLGRLHRGEEIACGGDDGSCWLQRLADESCKAIFVDTDALPARDSRVGDLVQNTTEAELVRQFTETLIQSGVRESQIGIISLYRQQVKLLQHLLPERVKNGLEILTADRSQGRDKECIIISLVRSNETGHIGDLVKDWRRMNVSFTRARSKLVIFGSRKTLQGETLLSQFFELMQEKGWILPLPTQAHVAHARVFDVCSTPSKRGAESDASLCSRTAMENGDHMTDTDASPRKLQGKENIVAVEELRPMKKMKGSSAALGEKAKSVGAGAGVVKGRPILQDLLGNET